MSVRDSFFGWLPALAILFLTAEARAQPEPVAIEEGCSFTDPKTGLLFARSLGGLDLLSTTTYEDKKWGMSLRYQHPEHSEWVDIYIYNRGLEEINDKNELAQSQSELESAFRGIEAFTGEGQPYRKVVVPPR